MKWEEIDPFNKGKLIKKYIKAGFRSLDAMEKHWNDVTSKPANQHQKNIEESEPLELPDFKNQTYDADEGWREIMRNTKRYANGGKIDNDKDKDDEEYTFVTPSWSNTGYVVPGTTPKTSDNTRVVIKVTPIKKRIANAIQYSEATGMPVQQVLDLQQTLSTTKSKNAQLIDTDKLEAIDRMYSNKAAMDAAAAASGRPFNHSYTPEEARMALAGMGIMAGGLMLPEVLNTPILGPTLKAYFAYDGAKYLLTNDRTPSWSSFGQNLMDISMIYPPLKGGIGLINDAGNFIKNWRLSVPKDANRYYRYVGDDAIADYIESGVIRASGANPNFKRATVMVGNKPIQLGKVFNYSMFSKGKPWEGSLSSSASTAGKKAKQLNILRSKVDTGPTIWEESNVDFSHKGHAGIFRPNYFGDLNATPTDYFEWWEPKKLGYLRHEFPTSSQPKWLGEYPKDNSKFGSFVDEGSEQTVFDNGKDVIKINFERSDNTVKEMLEHANKTITNRNSVSEQIPISLEGFVSEAGSKPKLHAVYRQEKLGSAYDLDEDAYQRLFADLSQRLRQNGWLMQYSDKYYNPELDKTLLDVTRQNVGVKDGKLYIFDGYVNKDGGKLK